MTLKQLEYFCAVAEYRSISLAARNIYIAQPSLSRQITLLEEELGTQLLYRTNKGIAMTEAGASLYTRAQELFRGVERLRDDISHSASGTSGNINIGVIYSNMPLLVSRLRMMRDLYPDIHSYVRMDVPDALLRDLRECKLNVLLMRSSSIDLSEFCVQTLREDPLELIVTRETDPAPDSPDVPIEALRGVPMCMLRTDDAWSYHDTLAEECRVHGFDLNIAYPCYDTPVVMQMVQEGFGISFLPRSIAETAHNTDLYAKPIRDLQHNSWPCLVWNDSGYVSACLQNFLNLFENEFHKEQ